MTIGYVGLGAMGRELAAHLTGDQPLVVWDISPSALQRFRKHGARAATSLADVGASCEIVVLCMPTTANVEQALFGEGGLASTLRPGTIIVDQTSGDPGKTGAMSVDLAKRGISLIDAPVAGGVPAAAAGTITIMASGPPDVFDRVLPALRRMSSNVIHCSSKVGDAQRLKAINNLVNSANRIAALEVAVAGRRLGLDLEEISDALNRGFGRSFVTSRLFPAIIEQRPSADFALALMVKDLNQAANIGIVHRVPMPVSETARGVFGSALSILGENAGLDDIVPFMERLMQTSLTGEVDEDGVDRTLDASLALEVIDSAMAACNRAIIVENAGMAAEAGLGSEVIASVMLKGSAGSAEAESFFAATSASPEADGRVVGSMIDTLTRLAHIGTRGRIPMMMINQVRARYLDIAATYGRDAPLPTLTRQPERET